MEKVERKDGPRFRPSYYLEGKKVNGPYFKRKSDAIAWKHRCLTEKMSKLAYGEHYNVNSDVNFHDFAESWYQNHVMVNCSPKTQETYKSILRIHIYPRFKDLKLKDISEDKAQAFIRDLRQIRKSKGVENIWIVFRSILVKAKKEKLISNYPLDNIKLPKKDLKDDRYWLKDEVRQFLLINKSDHLYAFYFISIHTGLRLAELCGLKWDRVDFSQNSLSITRTRDKFGLKETTKTKLKRIVPMTSEVRSILLDLFQKRNESPFIFLERDGREVRYSHIYRRFKQAQKKAGITNLIRFHDLRHSFASNFMMNGGNVFDLQKILGHTDIKMTMRYAHFTPGHLQSSLQFMNIAAIPDLDLKAELETSIVRSLI